MNIPGNCMIPFIENKLCKEIVPEPVRLGGCPSRLIVSYNEFLACIASNPHVDMSTAASVEDCAIRMSKGYTELINQYLVMVSIGLGKEVMFAEGLNVAPSEYRMCVGKENLLVQQSYTLSDRNNISYTVVDEQGINDAFYEYLGMLPNLVELYIDSFNKSPRYFMEIWVKQNPEVQTLLRYLCINFISGLLAKGLIYDWEL